LAFISAMSSRRATATSWATASTSLRGFTTDLSRLGGSFVVARNTAFAFKGKNVDAKDIGKELGVRYVLEGSVQRDQNQVRVNAQLIDAKSGGHIWAERFDKPLANLFSMQDDIVASLAGRLGAELMANEARRAERTPNPDSMDLYFQGMAWFNKGRNPADIARARDFFERALALDPDNFDAVLGRACADAQAATGYYLDEKAKRLASVEANLNRVLSQCRRRQCAVCTIFRRLSLPKTGFMLPPTAPSTHSRSERASCARGPS
jgi:TolB-like protein